MRFLLTNSDTHKLRYPHLSGFTLLEMAMVAAMMSLVGLAFVGLFATAQRYVNQEADFSSLQSEVAYAMEHITRSALISTCMAEGIGSFYLRYDPPPVTTDPSDDLWALYYLDGTTLRFDPDLGVTGTLPDPRPPPSDPTELVARRIEAFITTVDVSRLMASVAIKSEKGRAPEAAEVSFKVSPRSMQQGCSD